VAWLPPAYSPLSAPALASAGATWLTRSDPRDELARALRHLYEADRVVLTDSGTHALQLALTAARTSGGGTRVALPAFSCFDLATAALGAGVEPVFYDLDPTTLDPDQESFRSSLAVDGVVAVVVAPLFGRPAPWRWIRVEARRAGVLLVEDAAQGIGSSWGGRPAGSLGDVGILSFGRGKGWTGGGGGALLVRTEGLVVQDAAPPPAAGPLLLRSAAQWLLGRPALYGLPSRLPWLGLGETPFHPPSSPRALSPASARLALATHAHALAAAELRRRIARTLLRLLEPPPRAPRSGGEGEAFDPRCGYLRLPVLLGAGADSIRDQATARRLGILPSYPAALPSLPDIHDARGRSAGDFPGAEALVRELVTLPTHRWVDRTAMERMATLLGPLDPSPPAPSGERR
jgi:dTDP-4-amino-4,6-dideoxygalactose transaminase